MRLALIVAMLWFSACSLAPAQGWLLVVPGSGEVQMGMCAATPPTTRPEGIWIAYDGPLLDNLKYDWSSSQVVPRSQAEINKSTAALALPRVRDELLQAQSRWRSAQELRDTTSAAEYLALVETKKAKIVELRRLIGK